jgi:hypothetical protein
MLEPSLKSFPGQHDNTSQGSDFVGDANFSDGTFYNNAFADEAGESSGLLPGARIDTSFPLPAIETNEPFHPRETHAKKRTITTFQLVFFT